MSLALEKRKDNISVWHSLLRDKSDMIRCRKYGDDDLIGPSPIQSFVIVPRAAFRRCTHLALYYWGSFPLTVSIRTGGRAGEITLIQV